MHNEKHSSVTNLGSGPRHPQQEVIDLIAVALIRLRTAEAAAKKSSLIRNNSEVQLGFGGQKSVNANTDNF